MPPIHSSSFGLALRRLLPALFPLLALLSCQPATPANIVLITVDTLRADRLTPYGYDKIETPAIAALAREGIVFERAFADTSWTLPSLSSVMTGKYPSEHRVRGWHDTLRPEENTLAEILRNAGYDTAAIVGSYPLDRHFGLDQGFAYYDDEMTQSLFAPDDANRTSDPPPADAPGASRKEFSAWQMSREKNNAFRSDAEVADAAIEWMETNRKAPFFLWVHFFGPHEKGKRITMDPEKRAAHIAEQIARYDPAVVEMDREVGRVLAGLRSDPRHENTAIIFHSDHGQSLQEHGLFGHGLDIFDTTVHVPLIVRLPKGQRAGTRVPRLVRNLDIFSTVLGLARVDSDAPPDSQNLLEASPSETNHVYLESHHPLAFSSKPTQVGSEERNVGRILRGIRTDELKLISRQPFLAVGEDRSDPLDREFISKETRYSLFDLAGDERETKDQAKRRASEVERLRAFLDDYDDGASAAGGAVDLSEAARERLRSLGYEP